MWRDDWSLWFGSVLSDGHGRGRLLRRFGDNGSGRWRRRRGLWRDDWSLRFGSVLCDGHGRGRLLCRFGDTGSRRWRRRRGLWRDDWSLRFGSVLCDGHGRGRLLRRFGDNGSRRRFLIDDEFGHCPRRLRFWSRILSKPSTDDAQVKDGDGPIVSPIRQCVVPYHFIN